MNLGDTGMSKGEVVAALPFPPPLASRRWLLSLSFPTTGEGLPGRRCCSYCAVRFSLSLEGTAGVCGVCGDSGFPGDDEEEKVVEGTIPGTLERLRLDVDGDPGVGNNSDEDRESARALCESFIF